MSILDKIEERHEANLPKPTEVGTKVYYDVIFNDRVGNTAVHIETGGRGGSEEATIRLAELLAAEGFKVLVLTRDNFREPDVTHWKGVDYQRAVGQFGSLQCHALVNLRHSPEPVGLEYEHYFAWVHDVPEGWCRHDHLPREDMHLVAVSQWQLERFQAGAVGPDGAIQPTTAWKGTSVIHPILPSYATYKHEPVKHRFLYASSVIKGLVPTLELWRSLSLPADAELLITNPGYDVDKVPKDLRPNEKLVGILPGMHEVAELMRTCEGLFYVNAWPENFSQTVAMADAIGLKTHVLCTSPWAGVGGLLETAPQNFVTPDRELFIRRLLATMGLPLEEPRRRAVLGTVGQWVELLRLRETRPTKGLLATIDALHMANEPKPSGPAASVSETLGAKCAAWDPGMNGKLWPVWCERVPILRAHTRPNVLVRQMHPSNASFDPSPDGTWDLVELYFDREQFELRAKMSPLWSNVHPMGATGPTPFVPTPDPTLEIVVVSDQVIAVLDSDRAALKYVTIKKLHYATNLFQHYGSIMLADDDVSPSGCTWNDIFERFDRCGLGVAQPALTRESFYSHEITRQDPACEYRITNFCESMCALFTRQSFERHVHNFDTKNGSCYWALDVAWGLLEGRVAILDATPIHHGRAVNNSYTAEERQALWQGSRRFLDSLGLKEKPFVVLENVPKKTATPIWWADRDQRDVLAFIDLVCKHTDSQQVKHVFDLGSRDCAQSLELAKAFPNAIVHAFECNPTTLPLCEAAAGTCSRVRLVLKAVHDHDGTTSFYSVDIGRDRSEAWPEGNPGMSSLFEASNVPQRRIEVPCVRLNTYCRENGIEHVDVIWADMQGAELLALSSLGDITFDFLHTEVSHQPMYRGGVMFRDLDTWLCNRGMMRLTSVLQSNDEEDVDYMRGVHDVSVCTEIPLNIHHVWAGLNPFPYGEWRQGWMKKHPDATFRFWRGTAPQCDPRFQRLLDDSRYTPIVKADVLRWGVLLQDGGIYIDTDMECINGLTRSEMRDRHGCFLAEEEPGRVCTAIVGATAGHPFVKKVVDALFSALESCSPESANLDPVTVTGPALITRLVTENPDLVTCHTYHRFYPLFYNDRRVSAPVDQAVCNHHWKGSWKEKGPDWREVVASRINT